MRDQLKTDKERDAYDLGWDAGMREGHSRGVADQVANTVAAAKECARLSLEVARLQAALDQLLAD